MKKTLLTIAMLFFSLVIITPNLECHTLRIYLNDSDEVEEHILNEINRIEFSKLGQGYYMRIYQQNSLISIATDEIDEIKFINGTMIIYQDETELEYLIIDIDSLVFQIGEGEFEYENIEIGNQKWMAQNLNVTHYRNGDEIPYVDDPNVWKNLTTGAWCYYGNDPDNGEVYGKLYNWYAINDPRGLAPVGWRIPDAVDIQELITYLSNHGGSKLAGNSPLWSSGDLKEHTYFGISGFIGLPSGYRSNFGTYHNLSNAGKWWISGEYNNIFGKFFALEHNNTTIIENNEYKTYGFAVRCKNDDDRLTIGNQQWMLKNLDVIHYRNGDEIPQVQDANEWANLTTGAWCYHANDSENGVIYGKIYNWYAVNDQRGLAPEGWKIPSDNDWKELEIELGVSPSDADSWGDRGSPVAAKLSGGYDLWNSGVLRNSSDFNSSGFEALPGGDRGSSGSFFGINQSSVWWSSSEFNSTNSIYRLLNYSMTDIRRNNISKKAGFYVRCIRE